MFASIQTRVQSSPVLSGAVTTAKYALVAGLGSGVTALVMSRKAKKAAQNTAPDAVQAAPSAA